MIDHAKLTRENFDQWLATQPSSKVFNFQSSEECLIARFLKDTGAATHCSVYLDYMWHQPPGTDGVALKFPNWLLEISKLIKVKHCKHFSVYEFIEWLVELDEQEPVIA